MKALPTHQNFLGLDDTKSSLDSSKYVIQSFPYEHTSSYKKGSVLGPGAILQASHFVEFYDIELNRDIANHVGIATLPETSFDGLINQQAIDLIEEQTACALKRDKRVFHLGGEHTITLGCIKAYQKHYGDDFAVVQIDAHSDLRSSYEGNSLSHASVMARVHELGCRLFQIGVRAQSEEEASLMKKSSDIHCWYDYAIQRGDQWMDEVINNLPSHIYLTIDADGFSPSVFPEVGTVEPGGLEWYTALKFFKKIFQNSRVIGIDFVEICPQENGRTAYTAAQLIYKLIGYWEQWN